MCNYFKCLWNFEQLIECKEFESFFLFSLLVHVYIRSKLILSLSIAPMHHLSALLDYSGLVSLSSRFFFFFWDLSMFIVCCFAFVFHLFFY